MNCIKCKSSWTSNSMVTKCPFCGADIAGEETQKPNIYDNSKEALAYIMQVHGADVLLGSMLKSYFNDYAPRVETLRKNVIFVVSSSGAADILKRNMTADDVARENAFRQAVQRIIDTYGIERSLVESIVSEFTDALGWKIDVVQTSVAEMQHAANVQTSALKIGQCNVQFGRYNWRVLDIQNGKALLLSEDIIEKRPYNAGGGNITWEMCSLREYLNGEFLKTFNDGERSRIVESGVRNENNPEYGTHGGNVTKDNVFLLSIEEVNRYLRVNVNGERVAKYKGENAWWWLRSPGDGSNNAAGVNEYGDAYLNGSNVGFGNGGVRPAIWINLTGSDGSELTVTKSQQVKMQQTQTQNMSRHTQTYSLKIGQRNVKFGGYNWRVLDVQNDKALLLAEDVIEQRPYHVREEDVTWENCTLRGYLNGAFLETFSDSERSRIVESVVMNMDNPLLGTEGGGDTKDKVFLLSLEEVVRYFGDSGALERKTGNGISYGAMLWNGDEKNLEFIPTDDPSHSRVMLFNDQYSSARVARYNGEESCWWLRSPGFNSKAVDILTDGSVLVMGNRVNQEDGGARPALWINLTENDVSESTAAKMQQMETQHAEIHQVETSALKVGQRNVKFGRYNWRVLDVQNGKALLLSENVVEMCPYHVRDEEVTWENCSLRGYLNGEFLKTFSDEERSRIVESGVMNANNPWFGVAGGNDTKDNVFLLSIEEVVRYFGDSGALARKTGNGIVYVAWDGNKGIPTDDPSQSQVMAFHDQYSNERVAKCKGEEEYWWLRSPGFAGTGAAGVVSDGAVALSGVGVSEDGGVRPALWINLTGSNVNKLTTGEVQHVQHRYMDISSLKIGHRNVKFGRYDWRVLDIQNGRALLLAEDIIEQHPYHARDEDVTWEKSSLRGYLNGEFLKTFSDEERSRIVESSVINANNPWFDTKGGSDTGDKVFLLSLEEVVKYFGDSGALAEKTGKGIRYCRYNSDESMWAYCESSQAMAFWDKYNSERVTEYNGEESWWWLRSPGNNSNIAANIFIDGGVNLRGNSVLFENGGVRPALWINMTGSDVSESTATEMHHVQTQHEKTSDIKIGQRNVKFGRHNWRVLDVQNGKALLLAEEIIEKRTYNDKREDVTWEKCTLRGYLNGEFLKTFSDSERSRIVESSVMNANNLWFGTNGGNVTGDRVFLLSIEEVVRYFGDSGALARKTGNGIRYWKWNFNEKTWDNTEDFSQAHCYMDQYSSEIVATYNGEATWWWLRSPGCFNFYAAGVNSDGAVYMIGSGVSNVDGGVRPALWINLTGNDVSELSAAKMQQMGTTSETKRMQSQNVSRQVEVQNEKTSALKIGQRDVKFGRYDWRVLDVQNGKALLITEGGIDWDIIEGYAYLSSLDHDIIEKRPYHTRKKKVTWEKCSLREYLNGEFLKTFSDSERRRIVESVVMNANNPKYGTKGGRDTMDKIFLLSIEEVGRYFGGNAERVAKYGVGEATWWWLRSPGGNSEYAACVDNNGAVDIFGYNVNSEHVGVRPTLWIINPS